MTEVKNENVEVLSGRRRGDSLQTKYYCQVTKKEVVEVVMELSAKEKITKDRLPLRYVLVIDVSGSMDSSVGNNNSESLLERVKTFAKLVVRKVDENDSLAIVSFASDVIVNMPMTSMDTHGKNVAVNVINHLHTRGLTNLEIGLLEGLRVMGNNRDQNSRDMILIFTDGGANEGEQDAAKLVEKYKELIKNMNKTSCVPLAAFTIGNYTPDLLRSIASRLGSDAFYWLDEEKDFESDMLLPIFLRESTHVTDITINMKTLNGVTFGDQQPFQYHLQESSETNTKYFIHGLPESIKKHIPLTLALPANEIESLNGQNILHVDISFMDENMRHQNFEDYVILSFSTLHESKNGTEGHGGNAMDEISAYSISESTVYKVWQHAQYTLVIVAGEKYRRTTLKGLNRAELRLRVGELEEQQTVIEHAIEEIIAIKKTYILLVDDNSTYAENLTKNAEMWIGKLNSGKAIDNQDQVGRLFALKSSIGNEMPTSKGIYDVQDEQSYLPPQIEIKLNEVKKDVEDMKKEREIYSPRQTEINNNIAPLRVTSSTSNASTDSNLPTPHVFIGNRIYKKNFLPPLSENNKPFHQQRVKALPNEKEKKKRKLEHFGISRVFKDKTLVISESLRAHKVGAYQESYAEIIIRCGGRPDYYIITNPYEKRPKWYVDKSFDNYVLICGKKDYEKDSLSVHEARKTKIPIVRKKFMFDCIRRKKFLNVEDYVFNKS